MKVKVKKGKKTQQFELISKWEDVTLENWLKLIDFKEGTKTEEAEQTLLALSNIPKKLIKEMALSDVALLLSKIEDVKNQVDVDFNKIIEIDGVEYGFHPDLQAITLGEYADIEHFIKLGLEKHLAEITAILFRPVIEKTEKGVYTIEAYDGDITIRAEKMKKMTAAQVQSALVFFWNLGRALCGTLGSYLIKMLKEMRMQLQQNHLPKSGVGLE